MYETKCLIKLASNHYSHSKEGEHNVRLLSALFFMN